VPEKKDVKACYECTGLDACRPERLHGGSIRTSAVFGAGNLYCYTVRRIRSIVLSFTKILSFIFFLLNE